MAVSRVKVWGANNILTAADLNAEFDNLLNNGESLGWPATTSKDLNGNPLILDVDGDTSITADTDDQIDIAISSADDFRFTANNFAALDGSGIVVGYTNPLTIGGVESKLQMHGTGVSDSYQFIGAWSNGTFEPVLGFLKSRSTTIGTVNASALSDADPLGSIRAYVDDSNDLAHYAAEITFQADGAHAVNDVPGSILFSTTPSGSSTPTEKMRLTAAGELLIGTTSTVTTAGRTANLQHHTTSATDHGIQLGRFDGATVNGVGIDLVKSRNNSIGAATTKVEVNDTIGWVFAYGADGSNLASEVAGITFAVDAATGVGDTPGRIVFSTTADGAATATEAMRINSSQQLVMNSKKITGLANGSASSDAVAYGQLGALALLATVDTAQIDSGAIHQAELDTAEQSSTSTVAGGVIITVAKTGGQYTFDDGFSAESGSTIWEYAAQTGTYTDDFSIGNPGGEPTRTYYIRARYINSSPPYDLGDGEIPLFVFVEVEDAPGPINILGVDVAEAPPWVYNGPTSVLYNRIAPDGRKYQNVRQIIAEHGSIAGARSAGLSRRDAARRLREDPLVEREITQAIKNADMPLIPTPFRGRWAMPGSGAVIPATKTLLLDPVSPLMEELLAVHKISEPGEMVSDLLKAGDLIITPGALPRFGPPGVDVVAFNWR